MQMQATRLFPESQLQDFQVEASFENKFFDLAIQSKFQTIQAPLGWKMDAMAILCCRGEKSESESVSLSVQSDSATP